MSFKKIIGFSGFVLLFNFVATAHAQNLDQSKLDAIIHLDEMKIDIVNNHPKIYIHKIITLLNKNKNEFVDFAVNYDKQTSVKFINGFIYDKQGKVVKKIKRSDLKDQLDMAEFASDDRLIYYEPMQNTTTFPITVEYEYEISQTFLLNLPEWNPVPDYNVEVVKSTLEITADAENLIRFHEINNPPKLIKTQQNKSITFKWVLENFKAINEEDEAPDIDKITPSILFAPAIINYNNSQNQFLTWNDFGKWINNLNKDRDILTDDIKQKIIEITKDKNSVYDKAKTIYEFMQSQTRYISIQFGIGGIQPMLASSVCAKGYGDCKALSNLYVAMLKSIGINAYYTLVLAGRKKNIVKEFPANQFNHVIVCLPINNDTIWTECTSQKIPFGYLGDFTDNRDVLVVSEKSIIAHTKKYDFNNNITVTKAEINIDIDGNAAFVINQSYQGLSSEKLASIYNYYTPVEQAQKISDFFYFKNIQLYNFQFEMEKDSMQRLNLSTKLNCREYASKTSNRLFIPLNLIHPFIYKHHSDTNRTQLIVERRNYTQIDTVFIKIPTNYLTETNDFSTILISEFGEFSIALKKQANDFLYIRKLILKSNTFSPSQYVKRCAFFKEVALADAQRMILKKQP